MFYTERQVMPEFEPSPTGPPAVVNSAANTLTARTPPGDEAGVVWAMVVPKMYRALPRQRKIAQISAARTPVSLPARLQIEAPPLETRSETPRRRPRRFVTFGAALAAAAAALFLVSSATVPQRVAPVPLPQAVAARRDQPQAAVAQHAAVPPPVTGPKVNAQRRTRTPIIHPKHQPEAAARALASSARPAEEAAARLPQRPPVTWAASPEIDDAVAFEGARVIRKVKPTYPDMARIAQVQGTIRFRATIGRDGAVDRLEVLSGPPLLIQAARDAVQQWRFLPATRNGDSVEDVTQIDISFALAR